MARASTMPHLPDGAIWLASFPKSGNTWIRVLFSNLLANGTQPADINDLVHVSLRRAILASDRRAFEHDMLVDTSLLTAGEIERLRPAFHDGQARAGGPGSLVKVHDAFTCLADGTPLLGRETRTALYVVRDPRDVAVSYAFHNHMDCAQAVADLGNTNLTLGPMAGQLRQRLAGWSGHVRSWLDQHQVRVHLVRYEDLLEDTAGTFRRAIEFLGLSCSDEEIAGAVQHAGFAELQRQERTHGFRERVGETLFFREGRAGGWRQSLPPELARTIECQHADVMQRLGYKPEALEVAA
jgi:aryl sulfotransferase